MDIFSVFRVLYHAGIRLTPAENGDVDAVGPLTEDLRELIKTYKPALVRELTHQQIGLRDGNSGGVPHQYVVPPACIARGACHRLGPRRPPHTIGACTAPEELPDTRDHQRS
jgi:hypothetical protein